LCAASCCKKYLAIPNDQLNIVVTHRACTRLKTSNPIEVEGTRQQEIIGWKLQGL